MSQQPPTGFPPGNYPPPGPTGPGGTPWRPPTAGPVAPGWGPASVGQGYPVGPPPGQTQPPTVGASWQQPGAAAYGSAASSPYQPQSGTHSLGRQAPDPNSIENYRPPRSRWPIWLAGGAALIVVIVVALAFILPGAVVPVSSPSPTPTVTATSSGTVSTPASGATGFESTNENASGYWRVLESKWGSGYVDVQVEIQCEKGQMSYSFYAFANTGSTAHDSEVSDRDPSLTTGRLGAGETISGWVRFQLPHETSTIVLATRTGRQISALPISA